MLRAVYTDSRASPGDTVVLDPAESHHLVSVRRARTDAIVTVLDGLGRSLHCRISEPSPERTLLRVESETRTERPAPELCIAHALLKGKATDSVIPDFAALGVRSIQPVICEHGEVRLDSARVDSRMQKWRTAAREACKQSGNPWFPEIAAPLPLLDWLNGAGTRYTLRLVAALDPESRSIPSLLGASSVPPLSIAVLVGPEGDFSAHECVAIRKAEWTPVRLAPYTLRSETAARVALAQIVASVMR